MRKWVPRTISVVKIDQKVKKKFEIFFNIFQTCSKLLSNDFSEPLDTGRHPYWPLCENFVIFSSKNSHFGGNFTGKWPPPTDSVVKIDQKVKKISKFFWKFFKHVPNFSQKNFQSPWASVNACFPSFVKIHMSIWRRGHFWLLWGVRVSEVSHILRESWDFEDFEKINFFDFWCFFVTKTT